MHRTILHSDLNAFYASVECMLDPSLRGKAVAVCGSTEDRHGIVLAKSELAKKAGIKTGMVTWEAKKLCRELVVVPPQYEEYWKYSQLVRGIYERYTDQVEPYGMDECWLDVTRSQALFGDGETIAKSIAGSTKEELGLTVSIGVSYNKIFAKIGSDMKKPDAITVLPPEAMQERIWPLPASDMIFVGRSIAKKLVERGIYTIGAMAQTPSDTMEMMFGKNGRMLWEYANGLDTSRVMPVDFEVPIKSIGHGITCSENVLDEETAFKVMLFLSQDIGHKLRKHGLSAKGVQVTLKDDTLFSKQYQAPCALPTQSPYEMAMLSRSLLHTHYTWARPLRALTVRAISLAPHGQPEQMNLFSDTRYRDKRNRVEDVVDTIRARFGNRAIQAATLLCDLHTPQHGIHEVFMSTVMQG